MQMCPMASAGQTETRGQRDFCRAAKKLLSSPEHETKPDSAIMRRSDEGWRRRVGSFGGDGRRRRCGCREVLLTGVEAEPVSIIIAY